MHGLALPVPTSLACWPARHNKCLPAHLAQHGIGAEGAQEAARHIPARGGSSGREQSFLRVSKRQSAS